VLREEIVGHEKMLEGEPGNVALRDGVALLHAEVGNLAGAAAHFAETLRVNPQSPAAHYNLGMALLMQHKHDEAGEHLANAVALNPDYALAHDALGLVRQAQGRLDEARTHFERAVKLNPDNALARRHLDEVRKLLQR
jgi:superkiller protein 3